MIRVLFRLVNTYMYMYIRPDFRIFYKSPFASNLSWKKRSNHQGKKEVACIVCKPLVSCLWGCGESVNPPKLNIQEVQGALSSRPKGDPGPLPIFQDFFYFCKSHPWYIHVHVWYMLVAVIKFWKKYSWNLCKAHVKRNAVLFCLVNTCVRP